MQSGHSRILPDCGNLTGSGSDIRPSLIHTLFYKMPTCQYSTWYTHRHTDIEAQLTSSGRLISIGVYVGQYPIVNTFTMSSMLMSVWTCSIYCTTPHHNTYHTSSQFTLHRLSTVNISILPIYKTQSLINQQVQIFIPLGYRKKDAQKQCVV